MMSLALLLLFSGASLAADPAPAPAFTCPVAGSKVAEKLGPIIEEWSPFPGSKLYRPNDKNKHLAIVLLHGSEGGSAGTNTERARSLAGRGYAVLAFCYFDCAKKKGAPVATLKNVETSKVLDAVNWFRKKSFSNKKVVVYGFSRGAELTLITGSLDGGKRMPDALIAHAPSDKYNEAFNFAWDSQACWICAKQSCDENSPPADFKWDPKCGPDDPNKMDPSSSAWLINGKSIPAGQRIPIEKFPGPILITVGEQDEVWPADQTRRLEGILKKAEREAQVVYFPTGKHVFTEAGNKACQQALVLDFLRKVDVPAATPPSASFHSQLFSAPPTEPKPKSPGTGPAL